MGNPRREVLAVYTLLYICIRRPWAVLGVNCLCLFSVKYIGRTSSEVFSLNMYVRWKGSKLNYRRPQELCSHLKF